MKPHINGWSMISRLLYRRKKNQSDIARLLGISPAAVTQIKHGEFQLSGAHLERLLTYLHATPEECIEFYSAIIPARLYGSEASEFICYAVIERVSKHDSDDHF